MSDMFNVQEPLDVQDLSDVKEEKNLTPVTKNLKVRVAKAGLMSNENKEQNKVANIKSLKLELRIVDGIATVDTESGETIMKYVNKPLFTGLMDVIVWADLTVPHAKGGTRADQDWWKKKQHLVGLSQFCKALELPLTGLKITDEFFAELIGKELLIDIQHEKETVLDSEGKRVATGTFKEKIRNFKKA